MKQSLPIVIALSIVAASQVATGCARLPTGPDPFRDADGSARAGYSLTILDVVPAPATVIPMTPGVPLAHVEAEYAQPSSTTSGRVWVCLGLDASRLLYSSCRDVPATAPNGRAEARPGIYYVNGAPVVRETRYVAAFLVLSGDLVPSRRMYEDEIGFDRLSSEVAASRRVEHVLYWR